MTSFSFAGFSSTPQVLTTDEIGYIARTGTVYSSGSSAAVTYTLALNLIVEGSLTSAFTQAIIGSGTARVNIGATGQVTALFGTSSLTPQPGAILMTTSDLLLNNAGTISSGNTAIIAQTLQSNNLGFYEITNSGLITGQRGGIIFDPGPGNARITNTGTILGGSGFGIEHNARQGFSFPGSITVQNFGTIQGVSGSFDGGSLTDGAVLSISQRLHAVTLINSGQMIGDVFMGLGSDTYDGRLGSVDGSIFGQSGNDFLRGGAQDDEIYGGGDNDRILGFNGDDDLDGDSGRDTLHGGAGEDTLDGGQDSDFLFGGKGSDVLFGGTSEGNDTLNGGAGADYMEGRLGNDFYVVDDIGDELLELADEGIDTVLSSAIDLVMSRYDNVEQAFLSGTRALNVFGAAAAELIEGNSAGNLLNGGAGNDTISGGGGNDTVIGGLGADILTGGLGEDVFVFSIVPGQTIWQSRDHITDFVAGSDKLDLRGLMDNGTFIGNAAFSGAPEVRYQKKFGTVSVDVDGDGSADWVLTLDNQPILTASDMLL